MTCGTPGVSICQAPGSQICLQLAEISEQEAAACAQDKRIHDAEEQRLPVPTDEHVRSLRAVFDRFDPTLPIGIAAARHDDVLPSPTILLHRKG
ncbi:MAG TPA: hypothetical protein VGF67_03550 [Ktedonobacteraceae bacterium]